MNSSQLLLELGMPWDGVDPRYLTKAFERFRLIPEGTPRPDLDAISPEQLELFPQESPYGP